MKELAGPDLSVVVPVYGCPEALQPLVERLLAVTTAMGRQVEILLVEDGCPRGSWGQVHHLARQHPEVVGLQLSRNFGQHAAITAGLAEARGERVVVMDCDLQDPPEVIPELWRAAEEHEYDIVFARRRERGHSAFRSFAARTYFWLLSRFTGGRIEGGHGNLSLISSHVARAAASMAEPDSHYLFILRWLGFHSGDIEFDRDERYEGQSTYSIRKLVRHALNGFFFQTTFALRAIVILGMATGAAGLGLGAYYVYRFFSSSVAPGFTSIIVAVLILGGTILSSIGIVGLYVGRVFELSKRRPRYVVRQRVGARTTPTNPAGGAFEAKP